MARRGSFVISNHFSILTVLLKLVLKKIYFRALCQIFLLSYLLHSMYFFNHAKCAFKKKCTLLIDFYIFFFVWLFFGWIHYFYSLETLTRTLFFFREIDSDSVGQLNCSLHLMLDDIKHRGWDCVHLLLDIKHFSLMSCTILLSMLQKA